MNILLNQSSRKSFLLSRSHKMIWSLLLLIIFSLQTGKAQNITRPNIEGPSGLQVNSYTGSLFYKRQDLFIPGTGLSLDITFSYNSAERDRDWGFGYGWTLEYNQQYAKDSTGVSLYRGDGREDHFLLKDKVYVAPRGVFDVLEEYETGKFKLTTKAGTEYLFEDPETKKLNRIKDRNGNEITLTYTEQNIATITDAAGRKLTFTWSNNRLSQIKAEAASLVRTINYEYNGAGCMVAVKNPLGDQTTYTYTTTRTMSGLTDANGNASNISYNSNGAVVKIISCQREQVISYNSAQVKTHVTEKNGGNDLLTTYEFDQQGRLVKKAGNCCGYKNSYEYDADDNITKVTDANGGATIYGYDSKGNLLAETDPLGKSLRYTYDIKFNQITSITDKNGNKTNMVYDAFGNLKEVSDALSITQKFTYDERGNRLSHTDGKNNTTTYTYDKYGYLASVQDAAGGTTGFSHDPWGNIVSYTDPNSNETTFTYDALNQATSVTDALGNTTRYTYDANGNLLKVYDAEGNLTELAYDADNHLTYIKDALGNISTRAYDAVGNMTSRTDANGNTTRYTYDNLNRLVSEANALQETKLYDYDGNGNRVSITYPNGNTFNLTYDALNRLTDIADKQGTIATYAYDANSNKVSETDGIGNTRTFTYDALNRLLSQTDPLGNSYQFAYDANSNLIKETDRNGNSSNYTYDELDRQLSFADANGGVTAYEYDKAGNMLSVTDAKGNKTSYTYDALNRNTEEKFADNSSKSYTYDVVGNLTSRKDNAGLITRYEYDRINRPVKRIYPDATEEFTYDALGQLLSAKNDAAEVNFTYDAANRILSETLNGKTTGYSYDIAAGTKTVIYPGGRAIVRQQDSRNQLINVRDGNTTLAEFSYNSSGQNVYRKYANNTSTNLAYNGNSQVTTLDHGPSRFIDLAYTYDKEGNPLAAQFRHNATKSEQYSYDKLNQLTQFKKGSNQQATYNYDKVGNRATSQINGAMLSYTTNSMNAYTNIVSEAPVNFTYDENGNLSNVGSRKYAYDYENRLLSIDNGSLANYTYDALGRRISKEVGNTIIHYYFSGLQVIEERDGEDNLNATYVWGTWLDDVISMTREGAIYYYHTNSLGSVVSITNASGGVVESYEYDAYGALKIYNYSLTEIGESAIGNTYSYTGRQYEPESELYYYRARYYDANHGRFLQQDPLGYVDAMGLYAYVGNKPTTMIDPLGLEGINYCYKTPDEERVTKINNFLELGYKNAKLISIGEPTGAEVLEQAWSASKTYRDKNKPNQIDRDVEYYLLARAVVASANNSLTKTAFAAAVGVGLVGYNLGKAIGFDLSTSDKPTTPPGGKEWTDNGVIDGFFDDGRRKGHPGYIEQVPKNQIPYYDPKILLP